METQIQKLSPPAALGDHRPSFSSFAPPVFEQFCFELVEQVTRIDEPTAEYRCVKIDGNGKDQQGGDFLTVFNLAKADQRLELYEVKRVKNFSKKHLKSTVHRFLRKLETWGKSKPAKFTLIVATDLDAQTITQWVAYAKSLLSREVEFDIWAYNDIAKRLHEVTPDLIYRYFDERWVEHYFGKAGLRQIELYGINNYYEPQVWQNYSGERQAIDSTSFYYLNEHIHLLSTARATGDVFSNALISFRNRKLQHISVQLSHINLLNSFFIGAESPSEKTTPRPYLARLDQTEVHLALGSASAMISQSEATALNRAANALRSAYITRVNMMESSWRSRGFSTRPGIGFKVPIIELPAEHWFRILDFANINDAFEESGKWRIFDSSPCLLKVYTKDSSTSLDSGYHVIIESFTESELNPTGSNNSLILTWKPPSDELLDTLDTSIGPRGYWDALTTHDWLISDLIPAVFQWGHKQESSRLMVWLQSKLGRTWNLKPEQEQFIKSMSLFSPEKPADQVQTLQDLTSFINKLWSFFSSNSASIHFRNDDSRNFYKAIHKILAHTDTDTSDHSYFCSNLSLPHSSSGSEILELLLDRSHNPRTFLPNSFVIDCALRCAKICLRDKDCHLNDYEIQDIAQLLRPFDQFVEDQELLSRQRNRIGC